MGLKALRKTGFSWLRGAVFTASLMGVSSSLGALTFVSATGTSNQDLTDMTKPILYGGMTPGCTSDSTATNTSTCDSCAASDGTSLTVCNIKNVYPNLKVVITATTTTTGFTASNFFIEQGTGNSITPAKTPSFDGTTLVTELTWSEICQLFGKASTCESFSGDFTLGLKNSSATESITIAVRLRQVSTTTSNYADCDVESDGTNYGACHFKVYKGDEKLYATDLVFTSGYPESSTVSGLPYTAAIFFYETDETGSLTDAQLLAKVSSKSKNKSISVNTSSKKLSDDRVTGLQNDVRTCMVMANQDITGIISFYTPVSGANARPTTELCETPTKVVGLLDDKKCFIATAAFGSSMAPEVESFRQFRNHFLMTNPVGKSFVGFYYKHSPYFANMIAQSEVAKAVVRLALWPLLIFARVALVFGIWMTLLFTALAGLGFYEVYRRFFIARRFRGEL